MPLRRSCPPRHQPTVNHLNPPMATQQAAPCGVAGGRRPHPGHHVAPQGHRKHAAGGQTVDGVAGPQLQAQAGGQDLYGTVDGMGCTVAWVYGRVGVYQKEVGPG